MRKEITKIVGIIVLAVLQLTLMSKFSFFSFVPNLIIALSIILVIKGFWNDGLLVGVVGGLILDLASPLRFGFYLLVIILLLIFLNFIILKNLPTLHPVIIFLIATVIFLLIDLIIHLYIYTLPSWPLLVNGFLNGLLALGIFYVLEHFVKQEEIKFS